MIDHTRIEKIGGDSIFKFVVIQVEREIVMTVVSKNSNEHAFIYLVLNKNEMHKIYYVFRNHLTNNPLP